MTTSHLIVGSFSLFIFSYVSGVEMDRTNSFKQHPDSGQRNVRNAQDYQPVFVPQAPIYQSYQPLTPDVQNTPAPTFQDLTGLNLIEDIERDFQDIQKFIITLAENEDTLPLVNILVDTNPCVADLDGFLALVGHVGRTLGENAEDLENIVLMSNSLRGERNVTALTLLGTDILLQLDDINRNLDLDGLFLKCGGSAPEGIAAMREIALVLYQLSSREDIPLLSFSEERKESFLRYALIVEAVTNVLDHFRKNMTLRDCFTSKDFLGDFIFMASETMYDIAEALGALGYLPLAKEGRQYAAFTATFMGSLEKFEGLKVPGDCRSGSFRKAAKELGELAIIFADVGLEALATDLGVVLRLDLLP